MTIKMTFQEKAQQELRSAQRQLDEIRKLIQYTADTVKRDADRDAYGMTPGLSCSHAALMLAEEGAKFKATQNKIDMLTWLLDDENV